MKLVKTRRFSTNTTPRWQQRWREVSSCSCREPKPSSQAAALACGASARPSAAGSACSSSLKVLPRRSPPRPQRAQHAFGKPRNAPECAARLVGAPPHAAGCTTCLLTRLPARQSGTASTPSPSTLSARRPAGRAQPDANPAQLLQGAEARALPAGGRPRRRRRRRLLAVPRARQAQPREGCIERRRRRSAANDNEQTAGHDPVALSAGHPTAERGALGWR